MNILFLYPQLGVGGAQKVMIDLVNNLDKKEFNITVGCDGGSRISKLNDNVKIENIKFLNKSPLGIINSIVKLNKIIKENNIDIIHSHHRYTTALANFLFIFSKNIKVIHTEHNVFPDKNFINLRGSNIIAVSNVVSKNLIKNGVKEKNVKKIYNGIKVEEEFYEKEQKSNIIKIGVIARLNKQKGHIYLLEALKGIIEVNDKFRVDFIGDGEEKENITKFIKENGLNKYVKLCGNIDNVLEKIEDYKFFVLPSEYEGLPVSILEVMSKKKFLIVTDVGGNREIIKNEVNGFIVQSKSSEELKVKILDVLNNYNEDLIKRIEEEAYKTIKEKFSLKSMIINHINYYNEVINKNQF